MRACSKRCGKQSCDPCPLVSETARRTSSYQQHLLSTMSGFIDKAKRKIKTKVGQSMDRLRPSPRESRAASPVPPQQSENSTTSAPAAEPQSPMPMASSEVTHTLIAPKSVTIPPSQLPSPAVAGASSPPLGRGPPATPAYARPSSPTTILATTGSAVKGLLVAARDGSDLLLPLKAALVGVVAIWDIFDVRYLHLLPIITQTACSVLLKPGPSSRSLKANSRRSMPLPTRIKPSRARSMRAFSHGSSC